MASCDHCGRRHWFQVLWPSYYTPHLAGVRCPVSGLDYMNQYLYLVELILPVIVKEKHLKLSLYHDGISHHVVEIYGWFYGSILPSKYVLLCLDHHNIFAKDLDVVGALKLIECCLHSTLTKEGARYPSHLKYTTNLVHKKQ